jgi:putative transposase
LGNPRRFILSAGQQSDHQQAAALLAADLPGAVVADKGYDSRSLAPLIAQRQAQVVIPSRVKAREPRQIDENLYQDRNKIERFFNRIKHYRRIATRYEKTAASFLAFLHLAAAMILLL